MIVDILFGYMATQCLYVASQLHIADHLVSGEKNIAELAAQSNCDADSLYRIMRCLAQRGVFYEKEDKIFALNDDARLLISSNPNTLNPFLAVCGEELYQAAGDLLHTVKKGEPAFDHHFKADFWCYLNKHSDKAKLFNDAMESSFNSTLLEIMHAYNFSLAKKIIDVGGGKGHLVCAILKNNPTAYGIVYDLPYSEDHANDLISSNHLSSRCKFIKGDFFESVPEDGDLYLLRVILHDWSDEEAIKILKNCRKVIAKNGKLMIIERVIMDDEYKASTCLCDINMLVALTGKERTEKEYEHLLNQAGFKLNRLIQTKTAYSMIEAEAL